jgi:hypothetical protein
MRYTFIISILLLLTIAACNKNKYATIPTLKFKSVNTKTLHNGETIRFILSFTDAEGDLQDSIFVQKIPLNCARGGFKQLYKVPQFPATKNQKGDILISFDYPSPAFLGPQCNKNDTSVFKFVLKDKAQNKSDTITSPPIVIIF